MIDNIAYGVKIVLLLIGAWQLSKLKLGCLALLAIPIFMTGVELISSSESPWSYLFSSAASEDDYVKALMGGVLMFLPFYLFMLFGSSIERNRDDPKPTS
jgi:hypothetical protein